MIALEEHLLVQKPLYEEPEAIIPHLKMMSEKTGNAIKRKPRADDVKEALGKLLPEAPPEEAYDYVLKCCTERSDEIIVSLYHSMSLGRKRLSTMIRDKMYNRASKLIKQTHHIDMGPCESNWILKTLVATGHQTDLPI